MGEMRDGLLPRMEGRRRKDGLVTYRYHPLGGNPINLGTDREAAVRKVLDIIGRATDDGTLSHCWRLYRASPEWKELSDRTRADYEDYSAPLLKVFGAAQASIITRQDVRRYLTRERQGKVRANREIALLSNLFKTAIDYGYAPENPCLGIRRLKEHPRKALPIAAELGGFLAWLRGKGRQWTVIAGMAEFAARAGSRRCEFLRATRFQVKDGEARLGRAKQREGEVTDVVELPPELEAMLKTLRRDGCEYLFPSRTGAPYTESGFKSMFSRAMKAAVAEKIITQRFTFHDLRAHYATQHKRKTGALPDLHADPGTTARVYERSQEARRKAL